MARPRSDDKQIALLEAATQIIAEQGLGAPTALIARTASVADGTLFRYFPTKDDLFNAVYLHLKRNLRDFTAELAGDASLEECSRASWDAYVEWGFAHPAAHKAMSQLAVSDRIKPETHAKVNELLPHIRVLAEAWALPGVPPESRAAFARVVFMALADAAVSFGTRSPDQAEQYKAAGFQAFCRALGG